MSQLSLLSDRRFAPLFATQFLGAFNDNVYKNAVVIFVVFHIATSPAEAALLSTMSAGFFILPFLVFSAIAGQLADKYHKDQLIQRVKLAEIVLMLMAGCAFWVGELAGLWLLLFAMGAQSALFGPLKYAILPQHVALSALTAANGLIQMGTFMAILLGTIVGGVLVALNGVGPAVVSVVVLALAVVGWFASRAIPIAPPPAPELILDWNIFSATLRSMSHAGESKVVLSCILGIGWFWFIGATYLQLLPGYVRALHGEPFTITLLLSAFSVGIGLGSMACARLTRGTIEPRLSVLGGIGLVFFSGCFFILNRTVLDGAGDVQFGAPSVFLSTVDGWLVLLNLTAVAVFGGIYIVPLYALLQHRSSPLRRARIIAANNVVAALFMVCAALVSGALLSRGVPIDVILLAAGLFTVVVVVVMCVMNGEFITATSSSDTLPAG